MDRRQALKLLAGARRDRLARRLQPRRRTTTAASRQRSAAGQDRPVAPQTGGYKAIGDDIVSGFQLFLDLNDSRLGGHPVQLVTADEGDTAETGKAAARGAAQAGRARAHRRRQLRRHARHPRHVEQARVPLIGSNASPAEPAGRGLHLAHLVRRHEPGRALGAYVAAQLKADQQGGHDRAGLRSRAGTRSRGSGEGFGAERPAAAGSRSGPSSTPRRRATCSGPTIDQVLAGNPDGDLLLLRRAGGDRVHPSSCGPPATAARSTRPASSPRATCSTSIEEQEAGERSSRR